MYCWDRFPRLLSLGSIEAKRVADVRRSLQPFPPFISCGCVGIAGYRSLSEDCYLYCRGDNALVFVAGRDQDKSGFISRVAHLWAPGLKADTVIDGQQSVIAGRTAPTNKSHLSITGLPGVYGSDPYLYLPASGLCGHWRFEIRPLALPSNLEWYVDGSGFGSENGVNPCKPKAGD